MLDPECLRVYDICDRGGICLCVLCGKGVTLCVCVPH